MLKAKITEEKIQEQEAMKQPYPSRHAGPPDTPPDSGIVRHPACCSRDAVIPSQTASVTVMNGKAALVE